MNASVHGSRVVAGDTETERFSSWSPVPRLVSIGWAMGDDSGLVHQRDDDSQATAEALMEAESTWAHGPFDWAVFMKKWPDITSKVFEAVRDGRAHDVLTREKIYDIACGTYKYRRGKAEHGRGYSLASCVKRTLKLELAKDDDIRLEYGPLIDVPLELWKPEMLEYAEGDPCYTLFLHEAQERKRAAFSEDGSIDVLGDEYRQVRAKWGLHLASAWGIMVDQKAVSTLQKRVSQLLEVRTETLCRNGLARRVGGKVQRCMDEARKRMEHACAKSGIDPLLTKSGKIALRADLCLNSGDDLLIAFSELTTYQKMQGTYIKYLQQAGRYPVHASFEELVDTGRTSCIAKGTLVETVRDVSSAPKGVPIEKVKPGDLVYGYTETGELALRKVTQAWRTGRRQVVRLHWQGSGHRSRGHVDLTPEHLVKTTTSGWQRADSLQPGDRVFALSRGVSQGYARLWPTGAPEITREHRFIYDQVHGRQPEHVHHDNANKLDNRVENLVGQTAAEHLSHHGQRPSPELRVKRRRAMQDRWRSGELRKHIKRKDKHPEWLGLTRQYIEAELRKHSWSVLRTSQALGHDFQCFKDHVIRVGFDIEELKKLNRRLRREQIAEGARHARAAKNNNHEILRVEYLEESVDVYDLQVEDIHCFIAGEICVHNCARPNLQQTPRKFEVIGYDLDEDEDELVESDDEDHVLILPGVKECYVPRPGHLFACCDLDKAELVSFAEVKYRLFGRSALGDALIEDIDPHTRVAAKILGVTYDEALRLKKLKDPVFDNARNCAKPCNFGFPGGMGPNRFVGYAKAGYKVDVSLQQAMDLRKDWRKTWPEVNDYLRYIGEITRCEKCGGEGKLAVGVETQECPRCWGNGSGTTDVVAVGSGRVRGRVSFTEAANGFFQMLTADSAKHALWCVTWRQYMEPSSALFGTHIVNFIHDEIIVEVPANRAQAAAQELEETMVSAVQEWMPHLPQAVRASAHVEDRWRKG